MRLANSNAPEVGVNIDARPAVDYVEPGLPTPITNPITRPIAERDLRAAPDCFDVQGVETRPARRAVAYFAGLERIDYPLGGGDVANGLHAVIARQANGIPQGEQNPWPVAQRSTLFRTPDPWDRGAVRATPGNGA